MTVVVMMMMVLVVMVTVTVMVPIRRGVLECQEGSWRCLCMLVLSVSPKGVGAEHLLLRPIGRGGDEGDGLVLRKVPTPQCLGMSIAFPGAATRGHGIEATCGSNAPTIHNGP